MGLFDGIKIRKAIMHQQKGDLAQARAAYEELYSQGVNLCAYMLPWAVMLLREGGEENYKKAKEVLVKAQKASDLTPERRKELVLDFAVACFKLGEGEKAVELLERQHQKSPSGDTYGALGYIYVAQGDADKALAFNEQAVDYDDEDPVALDNLAQTYYRLLGDKEKALEYFTKAHEYKESQIDTLWFLSRYDLEKGDTKAAIEKLRETMKGSDVAAIKADTEALQQAFYSISEKLYQQQAAQGGAATGAAGNAAQGDDGVVDADYEVVDDDQ